MTVSWPLVSIPLPRKQVKPAPAHLVTYFNYYFKHVWGRVRLFFVLEYATNILYNCSDADDYAMFWKCFNLWSWLPNSIYKVQCKIFSSITIRHSYAKDLLLCGSCLSLKVSQVECWPCSSLQLYPLFWVLLWKYWCDFMTFLKLVSCAF